ncbi:MAG: hypothetical protein CO186_03850 [Zetaproteobacteria bacterium CG_4_9_14_3_um_filter_49_83]|nr:MAG: hypothetical protein AUJ56_01350 [Zetaproteobacteria bacterium CG1_02_49_23]PIQ30988.1 MAG: hypothetical protein COW62_10675 [Zetaproteobacteria bacterium CG17_big_fil_post_rev_8_21_14_2_50_50_13]PIV29619.1 MAG: hypothetical protein COS35_11050 [Zetaproteobacteria bacterium CG02_land_8_20_14_3_00_50_9]PIY56872.1 MAG: hypothetical protein COZ00_01665 [Zetaproteobacteria bacterium CG_4_10_14_0_8_um_filter_49_80]PJA35872.1 MAG: hypothetical protein CO186_03850 [Zetaproteobacteria bacterium
MKRQHGNNDFYDWLLSYVDTQQLAEQVQIGLVWTLCSSLHGTGLAMSPQAYTRNIEWPKPLSGTPLAELAERIRSWNPYEASVAMAAINAAIRPDFASFEPLIELPNRNGNLAVFDYFLPRIKGANIVVVGRYPGLERFEETYDIHVLERHPGVGDYPDTAAEVLLPEADWVFITASAIINKSFPRLAELSQNAMTVLMGPTTPWLVALNQWGVDFLAGVQVRDDVLLHRTVAEGGGRTIFDQAVSYAVADIGLPRMQAVKQEIARLARERDAMKQEMAQWYGSGQHSRFPKFTELESVQTSLSRLDSLYKQMWDVRHVGQKDECENHEKVDRESDMKKLAEVSHV